MPNLSTSTMNREQNIECMQRLYQDMACTSDPLELRAYHELHYLFRIVEAVLSENIDSLPTANK